MYGFRFTGAHDLSILEITLELDDVTWLNDSVLPTSSFGLSSKCLLVFHFTLTS